MRHRDAGGFAGERRACDAFAGDAVRRRGGEIRRPDRDAGREIRRGDRGTTHPIRRGAGEVARRLSAALLSALLALAPPSTAGAQETPTPSALRQLTLEEATAIALRRNPALEQSRSSLEVAEVDRMGAFGNFLPSVGLDYGFLNSSTGRLDPTGQTITNQSFTMSLGASYDLFTGFRRFSDLRSARLEVSAENARLRQSEFETVFQVKQAYFNAVANRELVRVERDRVARQEDQLEFVRQQVELGRATRSDLLRSQVDLNNARLALINAENAARTSTFQLAEVIGIEEPVAPVEEATLEIEPLPVTREELLGRAEATAPSVASAEAAAEAATAQVASARSGYLPSLSFSGGWAWQNDDFPPSNRSWSVSLRGSYPLFNGFQRENQVWRARAQADAAQARERGARLALRSDIDGAWSQVQAAEAGIELAEQSVELSRENLRVVQERYRLGLATILDLEAGQISLSEAQVELINRRFDYQLGVAQLEALLGTELREGGGEGAQ